MKIHKRTVDLSGFGGGYEAMCQTMLWRGIEYLAEVKPPLDKLYGSENWTTPERKALEAAMLKPGEDATGAMFGAAISHLAYIHKNGVDKWLGDVAEKEPGRLYEIDIELGPVAPSEQTPEEAFAAGIRAAHGGTPRE